jgi:hypothetical protein
MSKINGIPADNPNEKIIFPKKIADTLKGTLAISLLIAPICVKLNKLNGRVSVADVTLQTLSISLLWVTMSQQFPKPVSNVCSYFNAKIRTALDYIQQQLAIKSDF